MIRDRIVVGLQDAALSEKLQLEADLSLESAIAKVQQSKLIKNSNQQLEALNRMWRPLVTRRAHTLESVGMTPQNKL